MATKKDQVQQETTEQVKPEITEQDHENALPAVTVEGAGKQLLGASEEAKELLATLETVDTFEKGVAQINAQAGLTKKRWVITALIVHKTFSTVTEGEHKKLMAKFKNDLKYSRATVYNYRDAGRKLLDDLTNGRVKSMDELPTRYEDYIRPEKKEKVGYTVHIVKKIGEVTLTTGNRYIYTAYKNDDKENLVTISADELKADVIEVTYSKVDGKTVETKTCGTEKHETESGIIESPVHVDFRFVVL